MALLARVLPQNVYLTYSTVLHFEALNALLACFIRGRIISVIALRTDLHTFPVEEQKFGHAQRAVVFGITLQALLIQVLVQRFRAQFAAICVRAGVLVSIDGTACSANGFVLALWEQEVVNS